MAHGGFPKPKPCRNQLSRAFVASWFVNDLMDLPSPVWIGCSSLRCQKARCFGRFIRDVRPARCANSHNSAARVKLFESVSRYGSAISISIWRLEGEGPGILGQSNLAEHSLQKTPLPEAYQNDGNPIAKAGRIPKVKRRNRVLAFLWQIGSSF